MPYNGVPYGMKVPQNQGISAENMAYGPPPPKKIAYEFPPYIPYEPSIAFLLGWGLSSIC